MVNRFVVPLMAVALLPAVPSVLGAPARSTGRSIYKQRCAPCHGADGSGDTAMGRSFKLRDLRSPEVQKQTDGELADIVSKGRKGRMPAFGESLGTANVGKVVTYMRTLKAPAKK